ncbi:cell wall hydrolase [Methylobacterium oryzisoli]|uniref:cell wall hydrolase n=1 Tax=Methylobacterium oryzisoli TaxID=3385502 RepID=UPI0038914933
MRWICAATAPWVLGAGLLVSFTASAGFDASPGASVIPGLTARAVPPLPPGGLIGPVERAVAILDAAPLRDDLKVDAEALPAPHRAAKTDALAGFRSGTERPLPARGWIGGIGSGIAASLTPGPATWNPDLDAASGFVPFPDEEGGDRAAESSPASAASDATRGGADGARTRETRQDGATPAVPRAVALSSTTPAPADAIPVEVLAGGQLPGQLPGLGSPRLDRAARGGEMLAAKPLDPTDEARRRYADLITPDTAEKEQRCLAEAVYFEARGEPEQGQAAVAQVVLNRAKSGLYPSNICGVVYQNRHRYLGCQFSFACEGRSLRITDDSSWSTATRVARAVVEGRTYLADVGGATHYHADYVKPRWSRRLKKMDVIGRHIFYQLKPGQT